MQGGEKKREEIHSVSVRAGKRTYFFDVKETRQKDYYLAITESKKIFDRAGNSRFEKHKIFLYKEDFEKFLDGYNEVVNFIIENDPENYDAANQDDLGDEESASELE